jgi:DNA polymerase-3 subunit gamma/tau
MAYLSLFRRWRSQSFEDLVGQDHITLTLKNAIEMGRISQAYLFCGPRGTGKTSLARIFAKTLNCLSKGAGRPCNKCASCARITDTTSLDVIEIDAASQTKVEQVREFIINKVDFLPAESKYKIYIIDEVHKFSNSSFNALLKTLEEPPEHVIFIMATTDPHELPPTILSRCQRFDFRRIPSRIMEERLLKVAEGEKFEVEKEALVLIAEAADGSLRDALVLLEQVSAMAGNNIKIADVMSLLGITDEATLRLIDEAIAGRQTVEALQFLDRLLSQGRDLVQLAEDVIGYYRRLLLFKIGGRSGANFSGSDERREHFKTRSESYEPAEIMRILKYFMELRESLKYSTQRRLLWEMTLIRLTRWQDDPSLESIRRGLMDLERKVSSMKSGVFPVREPGMKPEGVPPAPRPTAAVAPTGHADFNEIWDKLLQEIKRDVKMTLSSSLNSAGFEESDDGGIILTFPHLLNKNMVEKEKVYLEQKAVGIAGRPVSFTFRLLPPGEGGSRQEPVEDVRKHKEFVEEAKDIFKESREV